MQEEKIPRSESSPLGRSSDSVESNGLFEGAGVGLNEYEIGDKIFCLQNDFTFAELEWLDVVYERLAKGTGHSAESNEVKGNFTRDEIERTLEILLVPKSPSPSVSQSPFSHADFLNTRESQSVKIIADFFLTRAVLGFFMKSSLKN
jgi:hypothetical protein